MRDDAIAATTAPEWLPPDYADLFRKMLNSLPLRPSRKQLAQAITDNLYEQSHRSMERWPVAVTYVNGRACPDAYETLEFAFRKLCGSTPIRGGRQRARRDAPEHRLAA